MARSSTAEQPLERGLVAHLDVEGARLVELRARVLAGQQIVGLAADAAGDLAAGGLDALNDVVARRRQGAGDHQALAGERPAAPPPPRRLRADADLLQAAQHVAVLAQLKEGADLARGFGPDVADSG